MAGISDNRPKALIVSMNFNPGHISHLIASYKQMTELGYESICYVNPAFKDFMPEEIAFISSDNKVPDCDVAIMTFPSLHNINLIRKLRSHKAKIIYIFHEPLALFSEYRKAGFSYKYLAKLWIIDHINSLTVKWSDYILIPSKKALEYYNKNPKYKNPNVQYIPLLYDDEAIGMASCKRQYISYIGTVAADHSFDEFLEFIEKAIDSNWNPDYIYLIATKSEFEVPKKLAESPRVVIKKGSPLTNNEINQAYASSVLVWNAYDRTTQSGVLAKAYMFGTPALVMKHNLNEFMIDRQTVYSIGDNKDTNEIQHGVEDIILNFDKYKKNSRDLFLTRFYYRNYNKILKGLL